jgi:predicted house-cleaning noncanonical NTP pyrophosphatase (MazG superfamily)
MRKKYYHRKLIRDKIPEIIKSSGDDFKTRTMDNPEFEKELKKKLLEEVKELTKAPNDELTNELADVLEIIKSISSFYNIGFKELERYRIEKRRKRGGFGKKLYLVWSTGKPGK